MNARSSTVGRRRTTLPTPSPAWAHFLDLDGTLVEIASTPSKVHPDHQLLQLIERLHAESHGALALITGRSIADIDRLFPEMRLPVAGQHGIERRDAGGRISRHPHPTHALDAARRELLAVSQRFPQLLLEDKGLTLALHYRGAPQLGGFVHRVMRGLQLQLGATYSMQSGKRVVELKPTGKDKGIAVLEFMSEAPFHGRTPMFIGDDATDEYGFAMINRLDGYSVKVGSGRTVARWRLADVKAVRGWLAQALMPRTHPRPSSIS
ncbi:MAG: trehalose-phosphatase [Gemmatimonadaceae bacterium]